MPDTVLPPDSAPPVAPAETSAVPPAPVEATAVTEEAHTPAAEPEAIHELEVEHIETPPQVRPAEAEEALPVEPPSAPAMEHVEVKEEETPEAAEELPAEGDEALAETEAVEAETQADETPAEPEAVEAETEVDKTPAEPETKKRWYVVKVQSGREDSIKEAIERRVKIEALEEFYGEIIIPTETVVEMRKGKRVKKERKLYPGYLMAFVEYNDRILYLFRETSGVGDFVGGTITRPPPPMSPKEIERMMGRPKTPDSQEKVVPTKPEFSPGDRVKVKDGAFAGMEGEVKEILEAKGQVRVEVAIFGRPVSLELEYWQVEAV